MSMFLGNPRRVAVLRAQHAAEAGAARAAENRVADLIDTIVGLERELETLRSRVAVLQSLRVTCAEQHQTGRQPSA